MLASECYNCIWADVHSHSPPLLSLIYTLVTYVRKPNNSYLEVFTYVLLLFRGSMLTLLLCLPSKYV